MRPLEQNLKIVLNEVLANKTFALTTFLVVAGLGILLGLVWPKMYKSSATIVVEDKNIITPLMQGAAVPTDVVDRAKVAREALFGNATLSRVMNEAGWFRGNPSPIDRDEMMTWVRKHTAVTSVGNNLIKIDYSDTDPQRAFATTKAYVHVFLSEALGTKARESQSAYNFINQQVQQYKAKLATIDDRVKAFRRAGLDPANFVSGAGGKGVESLHTRLENIEASLQEAQVKKASVEKQLAQAMAAAPLYNRERELRDRLSAAEGRLAQLRLTYRDTYPDIVRLKRDITDMRTAIAEEQKRHPGGAAMDAAATSAFNQQLKSELVQTQTQIDMLKARAADTRKALTIERDNAKKLGGATLSELMRDYDVTQASLSDLLKRREAARVSMDLDRDKQGLTLAVNDAPTLPIRPAQFGFLQFAASGLILALFAPFVLIYARNQWDGRVRNDNVLVEKLNLPVVASVPHLASPVEAESARRSLQWAGIVVVSTVFIVISLIWTGSHV